MLPCRLEVLLSASLAVWNVHGHIYISEGSLTIHAGGNHLVVTRAPMAMPFRWMVHDGTRSRVFASVPALLRGLRQILDPGHPIIPVRVAPLPTTLS